MKTLSHLFKKNQEWAESVKKEDPQFFDRLSQQQKPKYLWIGCADSRVPATQICNLDPGEMFVHRNIANLVSYRDLNCLSVIDYAVNFLNVTDIIVCGHYGCGGVEGALKQDYIGLINFWIQEIKETYDKNHTEIHSHCHSHSDKVNRLCELNVEQQIKNISNLPFIQKAWKDGKKLTIHGWIYGLEDGLLKDLGHQAQSIDDVPSAVQFNFDPK